MANRQPAVLNQKVAHVLWEMIDTTIKFRKRIFRRAKRDTIGFVDLVLDIPKIPGCKLGFRNIVVARVNGKPRIDMPSEQGKDEQWYPTFYPLSYELREVLTQRIFLHPEVVAAVQDLPNHPVQDSASNKGASPFQTSASTAGKVDNPFGGSAPPEPVVEAEPETEDDELNQVLSELDAACAAAGIEI